MNVLFFFIVKNLGKNSVETSNNIKDLIEVVGGMVDAIKTGYNYSQIFLTYYKRE